MKVVFSESAETDLREIGDGLAKEDPRDALTFMSELRPAARRLGELLTAFPIVPRYHRHGIRCCRYGAYLIFFIIEGDRISLVHMLFGAEDYEPLLFPDA